MRDTLLKLRAPFAVTVLVITIIKLGWFIAHIATNFFGSGSFGWDMVLSSTYAMPTAWLIAILVSAASLVAIEPVSRAARPILVAAAMVITVASAIMVTLIALFLTGGNLENFPVAVLGLSTAGEVLLQLAATVFIWRLALAREPIVERDETTFMRPELPAEPEPAPIEDEPAGVQPVWKVEEAVGAQWSRAGDAATGAQAVVTGKDASDRWTASGEVTGVNWAAIEGRKLSAAGEDGPTVAAEPAGETTIDLPDDDDLYTA